MTIGLVRHGLVLSLCVGLMACGDEKADDRTNIQAKPGCPDVTADRPIVAPRIWERARDEGLVWAVILLQEPPHLEDGSPDETAIKAVQDLVMDAMDVGPDEKVFAGKYTAVLNMELDVGRIKLLEKLPQVCAIDPDHRFWPTG